LQQEVKQRELVQAISSSPPSIPAQSRSPFLSCFDERGFMVSRVLSLVDSIKSRDLILKIAIFKLLNI